MESEREVVRDALQGLSLAWTRLWGAKDGKGKVILRL